MIIKLNWKAYFDGFCEQHGKPVDCRGRLLFADGWMYSRTDPKGPEWSPPTDPEELAGLKRDYWSIRLKRAELEYADARRVCENLEEMVKDRSAPLKTSTRYYDEETRTYRRGVSDISLDLLRDEIEIMREEVRECQNQLKRAVA